MICTTSFLACQKPASSVLACDLTTSIGPRDAPAKHLCQSSQQVNCGEGRAASHGRDGPAVDSFECSRNSTRRFPTGFPPPLSPPASRPTFFCAFVPSCVCLCLSCLTTRSLTALPLLFLSLQHTGLTTNNDLPPRSFVHRRLLRPRITPTLEKP